MSAMDPPQAWMAAWTAAWGPAQKGSSAEAMTRRLLELGQDYAGIARDSWKFLGGGSAAPAGTDPAAMQAAFAESYRRLLMSDAPFDPRQTAAVASLSAAMARCQRAWQALATQAAGIAADASRRLAAALADEDPAATPVTSLRELHDLWVECGEEAWAAAVHQDSYAAVQAEWLAAIVELMQEQRR
jgi:hypothetical protein